MYLSLPTTTEGNVLGAVGVLTAGTALGAAAGWVASPATPAGNKIVGAIEGGTIGVLATALAGLVVGEWKPKYKKLGEMTGLVGVGAVVALATIGVSKRAGAAQQSPAPPPLPSPPRQLSPQSGTSPGSRVFVSSTSDSGLVVPMIVGDSLTISLPNGSGADWFAFTSTGQPASGYQGLAFDHRSTQSVPGGQNIQYTYKAASSLGSQMVEMVFRLFATDSSGKPLDPQPANFTPATFTLWVAIR